MNQPLLSKGSWLALPALLALTGCPGSGGGLETAEITALNLNSPGAFQLSGMGTATVGGTSYLLAGYTGTISASGNTVSSTIADLAVPLSLDTDGYAYYDATSSGKCVVEGENMISSITGSQSNGVSTNVSATGCDDGATIAVTLDTSQLVDASGFSGSTLVTVNYPVDLAPGIVAPSGVATGNTAPAGTGTAYTTLQSYSVGSDSSLVATFTKTLTGGSYNATLSGSGCTASIAASALVAGSSGTSVAWTLTGATSGQTCTLNVGAVTDALGNAEDPNDPNVKMIITFVP